MLIPKNVFNIIGSASNDECRETLTGVYLERDKDGKAFATATDGRQLVRVQWNELPEADYPNKDGKPMATSKPGFSVIIPKEAWKQAGKILPKKPEIPVLGCLAVDETNANGKVSFSTLETRSEVTPIAGQYPDVDQMFPKETASFVIGFNAVLLAETLLTVAKISGRKVPVARLEFFGTGDAIDSGSRVCRISATNDNGDEITALVMPMRL